ncbi:MULTISPECIES: MarR family winged helix-turn-helix transcriptional regulator [unclassified Streptomyces]|uniref:MarR family winged helix-turn-helix transcriptional regulator n=1 Tax=unclassified Streptomyces TaxID=2593676 RepID=UPI0006931F88|nr:MarR family transcriptional regulator [Streptomyces sp. NBC_00370]
MGDDDGLVTPLAEGVERLMNLFVRTRAHMLDKARHDVVWSAQLLMGTLVTHGPMRLKELAGLVQSDPSTVSRQVAQLVRDGFVERRADAVDGRASLLLATDKARQAVADRKQLRDLHYDRMLHTWNSHDRNQLSALLMRFIDDFETYKTALAGTDWTTVRPAGREETRQ